MRRFLAFLSLALLAAAPARPADDLAAGFAAPPDSAKPRTWWHWVSGNVSREGITADLEAMKRIGVAGAQIFTVDQSDVKGPVVFMSPEWRGMVRHAVSESNRLGLELGIENCEGWSESGGPWVTPAQSMQQVVWTQARFSGGRRISLDLPQPLTVRGYYGDLALFAFPTLPDDIPAAPIRVSTPAGPVSSGTFAVPPPSPEHPQWILLEFARPASFRSLRISTVEELRGISGQPKWQLQVGDDGSNFRKVCDVPVRGRTSFGEVTGRFYRLWLPVMPPRATTLTFNGILLDGRRIDQADARTGIAVDRSLSAFPAADFPTADVIPTGAVIDLTGRANWEAPPGDWTVVRIGHTSTGISNHPASPATVGLECDKLSAAAVTAHVQQGMLGAVIADNAALVGRSLRYILCDSWEAGCENWTPLLRGEFTRRHGYDPEPWLLALTGRVVGSEEETQRFLWDFRRTLADLVAENHYGVLQRLAHENHMGLYAEAVGIGMPTVADQLQCKGRTDVPMGEFWVGQYLPGLTPIDDTKEAACAAHIYGQNIAAAESYTSQPFFGDWAQDPYSLKALGDLEFCLGINRFVFHRYAHQPWLDRQPGMSMGPWGTNFERTNTWWEPAAAWMQYLSRCQFLLQQGKFAADVCYYYGQGVPVDVEPARFEPKLPPGYDYDVCNTEILLRMAVKDGRVVLPDGMSYRALVLPDTDRMTLPVAEKIRELVEAGATVVGPRPSATPSLEGYPACDAKLRAIAAQLWDGGRVISGRPLAEVLRVPADFASDDQDLRFIHRRDGDADIYFVSNQAPHGTVASCTFRVAGKRPELWHPDTGAIEYPALYSIRRARTTLALQLDPSGSVFVIFRAAAPQDPVDSEEQTASIFPAASEDPGAPTSEGPVFRDGRLIFTAWKPASYHFVTAAGRHLAASAYGLPSSFRVNGTWTVLFPPKLEAPPRITLDPLISWSAYEDIGVRYFSGTATYLKDLDLPAEMFEPGLRQFLDLGVVKNLARVELNGRDLGVLWKEPFRVEITGCARPGPNHLEIKVTNLWPNRMIGDLGEPAYQRITWASVTPYTATSPLLPSGLLGPVVIRVARDIELK